MDFAKDLFDDFVTTFFFPPRYPGLNSKLFSLQTIYMQIQWIIFDKSMLLANGEAKVDNGVKRLG